MAIASEQPSRSPSPSRSRRRAAAFWHWWTGEISRLLPERFSMLRGARGVPLLALQGDELTLIAPHPGHGGDQKLIIDRLDEPRRRAAVRSLLDRAGESRGRARAVMDRGDVLVRRVSMPAATEENLAQVLAFEMDRLSPFRADEVYFDHRVVARDAQSGQIQVELAIARRNVVDALVQRLRDLGVNVQGVTLRGDAPRSGEALDLLPSAQRGERRSPRERVILYALLAAVVVLALAALLLPIYKKREGVVALLPVVTRAKQEAEATDAIVRELDRLAADYNFVLARKHGTYPAGAYIEELSRLLPDNTWLSSFDIKTVGKTREVQLAGETTSSSKLIEVLEQSKLLQNAAPRGSMTRGGVPGTERFMIVAEPRPRALPEPQALPASAPPPATPAAPAAAAIDRPPSR
jgi:general secretion pathway protein L